MFIFLRS